MRLEGTRADSANAVPSRLAATSASMPSSSRSCSSKAARRADTAAIRAMHCAIMDQRHDDRGASAAPALTSGGVRGSTRSPRRSARSRVRSASPPSVPVLRDRCPAGGPASPADGPGDDGVALRLGGDRAVGRERPRTESASSWKTGPGRAARRRCPAGPPRPAAAGRGARNRPGASRGGTPRHPRGTVGRDGHVSPSAGERGKLSRPGDGPGPAVPGPSAYRCAVDLAPRSRG